jgi:hypothetical protein
MKKILMTCTAIVALFALASGAYAITCTIDQRPAATLLVPYFEATFNPDGTPLGTGTDTLVTICNASAAPMITHWNVFNERTELVLDFNIALTGFDCQAIRVSEMLRGNIPSTGFVSGGVLRDACQRNIGTGAANSRVYPSANGFVRVNPANPATSLDNTLASTILPTPAWPPGSDFAFQVLDSLDETDDSFGCRGVDRVITNPVRGYIVIDHANYCNLSNPSDDFYYSRDAIGMENNLFGEIIFTSGSGIPTMGGSTVNIEAATDGTDGTAPSPGRPFENQVDGGPRARTFYARYWEPASETATPCALNPALLTNSPWNCALGDAREPLGLKYAARWFNTAAITSNFNVWRGSSGDLEDLLGPPSPASAICTDELPSVGLVFFDEDENSVSQGCTVSPCPETPEFNFPLETQRVNISSFASALPAAAAGWVSMGFFNNTVSGNNGGRLDQAWVEYDFQGPGAFLSASAPGTQLDPTSCNPLGVSGVQTIGPVIPAVVGTGP